MTEQIFDKRPLYNIQSVLKETGIKEDTLRAWERRYDLPKPERSAGGHRLFSRHDIETIKWLQARLSEGVRISQAVRMWHQQESGKGNLRSAARESVNNYQPNIFVELRDQWVGSCLRFDAQAAEAIIRQAFAIMPALSVCDQILLPGLVHIGELWYEDQASVQQEHFASEIAVRQIQSLINAAPPPYRDKTILLGAPRDEFHVIGLLYINLLLRDRGYSVIYLGANVPLGQMSETINEVHPDLVISSVTEISHLPGLLEFSELSGVNGFRFAYGGRVFIDHPTLVEKISGRYLGNDLSSLIQRVEELMWSTNPTEEDAIKFQSDIELLGIVSQARAEIYQKMTRTITADIPQLRDMAMFDLIFDHLTQVVLASIRMNELDLIRDEIDWARGLLEKHQIKVSVLDKFLMGYIQAIEDHVGQRSSRFVEALKEAILAR